MESKMGFWQHCELLDQALPKASSTFGLFISVSQGVPLIVEATSS